MIIDPRGMNVTQWTDFMTQNLIGYSQPPRLDVPSEWQIWALAVVQSPRIASSNPPNPLEFTDWRQWADRFNQTVALST
jgi:hypothetical protein